jgi:Uma2 family endonuclease
MVSAADTRISLHVEVLPDLDGWELEDDVTMPEAPWHRDVCTHLESCLRAWARRRGIDAQVGCNIALRWVRARPKVGVDPDVYLVQPAPPGGKRTKSLCTWKPGHHAPRIVVEVVSEDDRGKDYDDAPAKYAMSGVSELWVFDPEGHGPRREPGAPFALQVWRRDPAGGFGRAYAGPGPARSEELDAWLHPNRSALHIADDREGVQRWPTEAEAERERAETERERAETERERAETERARAEQAEARARALEAEIAALRASLTARG